jgi:hypothetical protein
MGPAERRDLKVVLDTLRSLPGVNPDRIGVQGGSQGGLHVLWCATESLRVAAGTADVITPLWASEMTANGSFRSTLMFLLDNVGVRYTPLADTLRALLRSDDHSRFRSRFAAGRDVDTLALYRSSLPIAGFAKWQDHYFGASGMAEWFGRTAGPRKFYGGTGGHYSDAVQSEFEYQWGIVNRWHERFVLGKPNGIDAAPPLTIATSRLPRAADGAFTWDREELTAWPSPGIPPYRLYLQHDSLLTPLHPRSAADSILLSHSWDSSYSFDDAWADRLAGPRFDAAFPRRATRYVTRPLQRDVRWLGIPRAHLWVRATGDRFPVYCHLYEVEPGGESHLVNRIPLTVRGWTPGATGEVTVEGLMHAHRFTRGNRIMVEMTNIDAESRPEWGSIPFHLPLFASVETTIYSDVERASCIELPLDADPVLQTLVADLRAEFDPARKRVVVSWTTVGECNNGGFWILRRMGAGVQETAGFLLPQAGPDSPTPLAYVFEDSAVGAGDWTYWLRQVSRDGSYEETPGIALQVILASVEGPVAYHFELAPNFPNPFNPSTFIQYSLERAERVELEIFSLLGERVALLVDEVQPAGPHSVIWNGATSPSGSYFCRLRTPTGVATRRMLLLR